MRRDSIGAYKKAYSTKGLWSHLKFHHSDEFIQANEVKKVDECEKKLELAKEEKRNDIYTITTIMSMCMTKQLTFQQAWIGKRSGHSIIQSNGC